MNRTFALLFSSTFLSLTLLSSCGTTTADTGEEIKYPTVADVERIDRQMGLEPRKIQNRRSTYDEPVTAPAPTPAPTPVEPAPELAPAPTETTPPPQPSVDPATLQKLR